MFVKVISKRRWRTVGFLLLLVVFALLLLLFPRAAAGGISRGLSICSSVLIPALFPFLVLSGVTARSGIAESFGNRLEPVTRFLFGLPGCCTMGILFSFLGGYPAGAAAVGELVRSDQVCKEEARRMLRFCVNGGPSFLVAAVGAGLMNSAAFGWLLLAAHWGSSLLMGILGAKRKPKRTAVRHITPQKPFAVAFVEAVTGACETMLTLCGFVLVFATVLALGDVVLQNSVISALFACLLEVNCGCLAVMEFPALAPFLLGCTVGFGGFCVHCQVAAQLHGTGVITPRFFLSRTAHALLTGLFTVLLLRVFPLSLSVGTSLNAPLTVKTSYGTATVSVALLVLCGVWMLLLTKKNTADIIR